MEYVLIIMFVVGIILVVTTTITISNLKYKLYGLERDIHNLSTRLEESIRSNEEASSYTKSESTDTETVPVEVIVNNLDSNKSKFIEVKTDETVIKDQTVKEVESIVRDGNSDAVESKTALKEFKHISDEKVYTEAVTSSNEFEEQSGTSETVVKTKKLIKAKSNLFTIESIISKLGILLLLIGVGFIYKLAYDKGYITPTLVVFMGYVFGIVVLGVGLRVRKKQRELLSQVLFGGGIAILYITTFAAYQGYGLMGGFLAFVILFAITFLAFFIALSIDSMAMSIIALLGSLLTPFVVGIEVLGLYGTGLYILFIAAGSMAVYVFKRWRTLQLTSIVGINLITLLLTFDGGFSTKETFEFSILLTAILIVFYGVEYVHFYLGRDYKKELFLTVGIISILPVITLLQVLFVLDISETAWALIFAAVALVFFGLNFMLYKKRDHSLITDVLMGYIGMFTLIGIILYFGGEVRYIAILILALIFVIIHSKSKYLLTRIIGLIIYGIGYTWALFDLIEQSLDGELEFINIVVRIVVMVLITFIAFMQKDMMRKILGGLAFQLYFSISLIMAALIWTEDIIDPVVMFVVIFGLLIVGMIWVSKKFDLISIHALVAMSILPFIVKLTGAGFIIYEDSVDWLQTLFFVLYGVEMYILTLTVLKNNAKLLIFILKCIGYGMLISVVLVEFTIWSNHFGYSLILLVGIILGIDFIENDEDQLMAKLRKLVKIGFMAVFIVYVLMTLGDYWIMEFNFLHFIVDLSLIVSFAYFLKDYLKDERYLYIIISLVYMIVIYMNLHMGDNGIVTLFWAGYGILSLAYFLFKGRRNLVYIALGLIVLVAVKFILVDLSTIEVIWKIVTSMAFGAALLVLSYIIQPLLDKYGNEEAE